jgi:hypothetical protein
LKCVKSLLGDTHRLRHDRLLTTDTSEVVHFKEILEMQANAQTTRQKSDEKAIKTRQEKTDADKANEIRLWEKHFNENKYPPATVQPSIEANEFTKIMSKLAKVELTKKKSKH